MKTIKLAIDFSRFPIGRNDNEGEFNGDKFKREVLLPRWQELDHNHNENLIIDLDGIAGVGRSFLDSSFGVLLRDKVFTENDLKKRIVFQSKDLQIKEKVDRFIQSF